MLKPLDPLLHSELRLGIVSILMNVEEADFTYLKSKTRATSGNISVQIDKLANAGYIVVTKGYLGKKPRTVCKISDLGKSAFESYVEALKSYLNN